MKRLQIAIFILLVGAAALPRTGLANDDCRLVAGYGMEPPYHYPDQSGQIIGIDADILRAAIEDAGCNVEFVELPWKRTLHMISNGDVDVTLGASFKKDRATFAHYSVPYRGQPHAVFEDIGKPSGASDLDAFLSAGSTLGVILGWHYTNKIQRTINKPAYRDQIVTAVSFENALKMSDGGRFDGFLANPSLVAAKIGKTEMSAKYRLIKADIDILHFLFSKASIEAELFERINRNLILQLDSGLFSQVCSRYEHMLVASCSFLSAANPSATN